MYKLLYGIAHNIKATDLNKAEGIAKQLCRYYEKDMRELIKYIDGSRIESREDLINTILEFFDLYDIYFNMGEFQIHSDIDPIIRTILGYFYRFNKIVT
jgi:hypothetical protein